MWKFGQGFLSYVDPFFVQDIEANFEWYLNYYRESLSCASYNEILLNCNYPSRQEREFLKHVEQAQQKKNDDKYVNILRLLAKQGSNDANEDPEDFKKGH